MNTFFGNRKFQANQYILRKEWWWVSFSEWDIPRASKTLLISFHLRWFGCVRSLLAIVGLASQSQGFTCNKRSSVLTVWDSVAIFVILGAGTFIIRIKNLGWIKRILPENSLPSKIFVSKLEVDTLNVPSHVTNIQRLVSESPVDRDWMNARYDKYY